jgi:O-antigen ligase
MASIAASQILLGLTIVALAAARARLKWPPVTLPVAVFFCWTVLSLAASGHASQGLPQIKKFYVFLILFAVYSAIGSLRQVRWIALGPVAIAALSAAWSLEQGARKYIAAQAAHQDFYITYVPARITGFMSHWMTFSGEMMIALMILGALLLFSTDRPHAGWLLGAGAVILAGLLASFTRSMWAGAAAGGVYLLWFGRRWLLALVPVFTAAVLLANPFDLRERAVSIFQPHGDLDSNAHRALLRRVGWEMIKAHPLLGVGPEQVAPQFDAYLPPDVPRPLPEAYYTGHLHNIYFQYAAERGLPALAALLWMLGRPLYDFLRALHRIPKTAESRWVLHAAAAVIIAVMVGGFYEVNLGDSEVLTVFLAMLACGYAAIDVTGGGAAPRTVNEPRPVQP